MWDRANGRSETECTNISGTSRITSTNRQAYISTCPDTISHTHALRLLTSSLVTLMIQSRVPTATSVSIIGSCNYEVSNHTESMSCQRSDWRFHIHKAFSANLGADSVIKRNYDKVWHIPTKKLTKFEYVKKQAQGPHLGSCRVPRKISAERSQPMNEQQQQIVITKNAIIVSETSNSDSLTWPIVVKT